MKKRWLKLCSLVLVIVMTVNSLPMNVFAEQYQSSKSTPQETTTAAEQLEEQSAADHVDARITEECIDDRTEYSKEFLLDNGTHLAVVYDSAVHYEKDGNWEEIDNTLQVKPNGTITNKAGVWDVAFPQQIDGSNQISITKDGHTLSFGMAGELRQQGDLEVMSEGEENSSSIMTPDESSDSETMLEAATPETEAAEGTLSEDITQEEEVTLQEGEPEETIPAASVTEETIPEISSAAANVTEQDTTQLTTSIMTDGAVQTFAVSAVRAASGQIQTIDRREALAEAEHAETVLEKPASQLLYADVYTNTDVQYDLVGNQVKESIILESYSSTLRGYRYTLNTGDMIPVLNDDGSIHFYDSGMETVVMVMPAPYLEDKNLEHCEDIQVNLSGGNGVYTLSYLLPLQWLAEEDRAWPVVLDPVVTADSTMWNIQDQTVMSAKEYSHTWGALQIGQSATSGICRPYVAFKNLPSLYSSDVIINATISLYNPNSGTKTILTTVHKVDETWNSSTLQWDNMPSFQTDAEDYALVSGGGWYHWEVTDIVRGWYSGENTGMMFKASDEDEAVGPGHYKQFYSSDWGTPSYLPHLTITYRNNNGLESYWDYTSSSAGRAGTGHINQYTGNLVWVHNDLGFGGNRMPVSISHIYNANDTAVTRFGMGNGWRTNFNQRVYQWSANTNYYISSQSHKLSTLNRRGMVDPDIFISKSNQLAEQLRNAKQQKERTLQQEDRSILDSTEQLLETIEAGPEVLEAFDEELFCELIDKIIVESNVKIRFRLKNGLELPETIERMVR